jgi:hypothetical protein
MLLQCLSMFLSNIHPLIACSKVAHSWEDLSGPIGDVLQEQFLLTAKSFNFIGHYHPYPEFFCSVDLGERKCLTGTAV